MRFKFRYIPGEDRLQFNLATDELQFACWLTRRQSMNWLRALSAMGCQKSAAPRKGRSKAAAGAAPPGGAATPVQQLQSVTFRAGKDKLVGVFSPVEGENVRFVQGRKIAEQVYPVLYSVAEQAGWDPASALQRLLQAGKKSPPVSHSLH